MSYNYLFKFVIIGDASVGKSAILNNFIEDNLLITILW